MEQSAINVWDVCAFQVLSENYQAKSHLVHNYEIIHADKIQWVVYISTTAIVLEVKSSFVIQIDKTVLYCVAGMHHLQGHQATSKGHLLEDCLVKPVVLEVPVT